MSIVVRRDEELIDYIKEKIKYHSTLFNVGSKCLLPYPYTRSVELVNYHEYFDSNNFHIDGNSYFDLNTDVDVHVGKFKIINYGKNRVMSMYILHDKEHAITTKSSDIKIILPDNSLTSISNFIKKLA